MRKISEILMDEHKYILKVADALEKEYLGIKKGKQINKEFLTEIIDFIRNYADRFHHDKEEEILFREMCKGDVAGKLHCNAISQMVYEHDLGREFVKNMLEAIDKDNKNKLIENAKGYVDLIREHIYKEDNILYPMADDAIDDVLEDKMLVKFKKEETKRKLDKTRYIKFVNSLKNGK